MRERRAVDGLRSWSLPVLAILVACGQGGVAEGPRFPDAVDDGSVQADGAHVPYDRAIMKTTHNAYDRSEPLFDQLVWHRIRSIELDIHVQKSAAPDLPGDWYVYHADLPTFRETSCTTLASCLGQLAAFHAAVPKHEVVTLFVDLKEDFEPGHDREDLDALLAKSLGRDAIVTPADLLGRCAGAKTLRDAVTGRCGFPTLADLRGKVLVAVTGGSLCEGASRTSEYGAGDPKQRLAFLAPDLDASCPIEAYDRRPDVVFLNMGFDERRRAKGVRARGLVARVYAGGIAGGLDSPADFAAALAAGAQLLATDRVNASADPWATTTTKRGWPFRCGSCTSALSEPGDLVAVGARSGDVGSASDSFFYAYEEDAGPATWSAFVSVPSSHVEASAKACLMARASDAPGAANVALCRPFDDAPPRLQIRGVDGGPTSAIEMRAPDGVSAETPAFLRLALRPTAAGTDVVAEGSADGKVWSTIGRAAVAAALRLRGLAVASRGAAPVRAIFGDVTRTKGSRTARYAAASFTAQKAIGAGASGEAFDGVAR